MKVNVRALALCACVVFVSQAWANVLPAACGPDNVKFDVKTEKNQPAPEPPPQGKAQIVLIQTENIRVTLFSDATVRFGMDGAWVGADNGNSYFTLTVDPGIHHLCASWQSAIFKKSAAASVTAKPGRVYYFVAPVVGIPQGTATFGFSRVNADQGKYLIEKSKLSVSKPKK
jgi:hypothetical protein